MKSASLRPIDAVKSQLSLTLLCPEDIFGNNNGNDSNDGLTLDTPFEAIRAAAAVMQAGDTCTIRDLDTHVYVISTNMPLNNTTFLLAS